MFRDDKPLSAAGVSSAAIPFTVTFQPFIVRNAQQQVAVILGGILAFDPSVLKNRRNKFARLKLDNNLLENVQIEG